MKRPCPVRVATFLAILLAAIVMGGAALYRLFTVGALSWAF